MAEEVVQISDEFYILSTSSRVDDRTRVLKHGDTFAIFDRFGDVEEFGAGALGLYHQDTRFLSRLVLRLAGVRPLLLSSTVKNDNAIIAVDLTNPDVPYAGELVIPRGSIHVFRSKVLWDATCHEWLRIHNYGLATVDLSCGIEFGADFADIFEARGLERERRGRRLPPERTGDALVLAYEGLDGRVRRTRIAFDPPPTRLDGADARFDMRLRPRDEMTIRLAIACSVDDAPKAAARVEPARGATRPALWYEDAAREATEALDRPRAEEPLIVTSSEQLNEWLDRSVADLHLMRTETEHGAYPYAGIPWFSTAFGRDGIITALECLWLNPRVARGVLTYLAATQAESENAEQDAQPGKILHETRSGEMAALGEVPFARYYGSVDSTPLFVVLAGAYYGRTGDVDFARAIWPNVERALDWIDHYGDCDGDLLVEYARHTPHGLVHQGWKDSVDSVFHDDGSPAEAPIALCEVQGYAYQARLAAATLAGVLGLQPRAQELTAQATALRERFEAAFWCEELSTYALALDAAKRPCRVRTSNAGHCLYSGVASDDRARRVAATLTDGASFSGWGIRTVAASEARYNPMSYHNGSVWPHDNAIVAAGFARYGLKNDAAMILTGLFDASRYFDLHRLPELFCGFRRRPGESPTQYPVSCSPQAWASGAVLLMLQACLGLDVRGPGRTIVFDDPCLPPFIDEIEIQRLRIGPASVDLSLTRKGSGVGINVLRREGPAAVVTLK